MTASWDGFHAGFSTATGLPGVLSGITTRVCGRTRGKRCRRHTAFAGPTRARSYENSRRCGMRRPRRWRCGWGIGAPRPRRSPCSERRGCKHETPRRRPPEDGTSKHGAPRRRPPEDGTSKPGAHRRRPPEAGTKLETQAGSGARGTSPERTPPTLKECWNCESTQHAYAQCGRPRRESFCFGCGERGATVRMCPRCGPIYGRTQPYSAPRGPRDRLRPE